MPTYFVKTRAEATPETGELLSRSLVIEANFFEYDDGNYNFFKDNRKLIASVPNRDVFAVVEEEAYGTDYFFYPPDYEDLEDDWVCDGCLGAETDPEISAVPVPETPVAVPDARDESYPIEKWQFPDGDIQYGFHTSKGFVNTQDNLSFAKECRSVHRNSPDQLWSYLDLTGATKLEENL